MALTPPVSEPLLGLQLAVFDCLGGQLQRVGINSSRLTRSLAISVLALHHQALRSKQETSQMIQAAQPSIFSATILMLAFALSLGQIESACAATAVPDRVKIGNETKNASGVLIGLQSGDVACYLTLKDQKGQEFTELAIFEICEMTQLVGKRVRMSYRIESVLADSCQGDPECKDTQKVAIVSTIKVLKPGK
jgi:hypothetical protein